MLMIVQPGERNSTDQRWIQYKLWEDHKIKLIRRSLLEVCQSGRLDVRGALLMYAAPITILLPILTILFFRDGMEVAVGYFRGGYTPTDYPTTKARPNS